MKIRKAATTATATLLIALAAACAETPVAPASEGVAGVDFEPQLEVLAGDAQVGVVNRELPRPVIVRLTTPRGAPVAGMHVNFVVTSGNGHMWAGSSDTNEDGIAWDWWTLGTNTSQEQTLEVRYVSPRGTRRVGGTFAATAIADAPASIYISSVEGSIAGQNPAMVGGLLNATPELSNPLDYSTTPLRYVVLRDRYGNRVAGEPVVFSASVGTVTDTVFTDSSGLAPITGWVTDSYAVDTAQFVVARAPNFSRAPGSPAPDSAAIGTYVYPAAGLTLRLESLAGDTARMSPDTISMAAAGGLPVAGPTICLTLEDGDGNDEPGTYLGWNNLKIVNANGQTARVDLAYFGNTMYGGRLGCALTYFYPPNLTTETTWDLRFTIPGVAGEVQTEFVLVP